MIATPHSHAPSTPAAPTGLPTVRPATPDDDAFVDELHSAAFGPGRFSRTAFRVREQFPIDPSLTLIAEVDGVACGSVWMTPISIGGTDGYMLGPLATDPAYRKRGAGKLLAREAARRTLERGEGEFIILIGDQDYYCPLGWVPTVPGSVIWPGPVDLNRVLVYAPDPTLKDRLEGPIGAFGAAALS